MVLLVWSRRRHFRGLIRRREMDSATPSRCSFVVAKTRIIIGIASSISIVLLSFPFFSFSASASHQLPILFNFGDSNSDTGGYSATFHRLPSPHGVTFFGRPAGRYSDGRLLIDFIAEKLGIPYLGAYLDSIAPDYRHGANFAASGATIQPTNGKLLDADFNPVTLGIQILEFQQFKDRTIHLYQQDQKMWRKSGLPTPEDFSKALYTLDCGQNDLDFGLLTVKDEQKALASIAILMNQFSQAIKELYQEGARKFWIHNTGPFGCLPIIVITHPPKPGNADPIGCVESYNLVAQDFNKQLNQSVTKLRTELPDALLILVDVYSAKYSLISEAKEHAKDLKIRWGVVAGTLVITRLTVEEQQNCRMEQKFMELLAVILQNISGGMEYIILMLQTIW